MPCTVALPQLSRNLLRHFGVCFGVNLRDGGMRVAKRNLSTFEAVFLANLGAVCVAELVGVPAWHFCYRTGLVNG